MGRRAVYFAIAAVMAAAVLLLVPVGIFREERISHNGAAAGKKISLAAEMKVTQYFTPACDYIRSISVFVDCENAAVCTGELHFALYDEDNRELRRREYNLAEVIGGGFFEIPVGCAVKTKKMYTWELWVTGTGDTVPALVCTAAGVISPPENRRMIVGADEDESAALNMYTYGARQGKVATVNYIAFVLWAGISLAAYLRRREMSKQKLEESGASWAV